MVDDHARRFRLLAHLLVALIASLPVHATCAESQPLTIETARRMLHVRPGATCLTADDLAADIPRWLHGDVRAPEPDVEVWVDGSATDPRVVRVHLSRAGEVLARRDFQPGPAACAELRSAVSLSIAMALLASAAVEAPSPPAPPRAEEEGRRVDLFVGGSAVFRLLPEALFGPQLHADLSLGRHFFARAGALGLIARKVPLPSTSAHFDSFLVAARTALCAHVTLAGPLAGHACAGVLAGALLVRGRDENAPPRETLGWAAFTSELGLTLAASKHLLVTVEPGLVVPLRDVRIGIVDENDDVVSALTLRAIAFSLGLGVGYRF